MFQQLLDMVGGGKPLTINGNGELVDDRGRCVGQVREVSVTRDMMDIHTVGGPSRAVQTGCTRFEIEITAYDQTNQITAPQAQVRIWEDTETLPELTGRLKPTVPSPGVTVERDVDLTEELGEG